MCAVAPVPLSNSGLSPRKIQIIPTMTRPNNNSGRAWPVAARTPARGQPPVDHRECASLTLRLTMGGRNDITWACHAPWDAATGRFISRRTVWLTGRYPGLGTQTVRFCLHDSGAQHRTKLVWARPHSPDANAKIVELTRVPGPSPTVPPTWQNQGNAPQSAHGFFALEPSNPHVASGGWIDFDHRYELEFAAPWCELEVFYDQYPVGTIAAQMDDNGPPPIPPVSMEN